MPNLPILCMICNETIKGDQEYLTHMQTVHGTNSPDQAMKVTKLKEQNIPKEILIGKDIPPTPEFLEVIAAMDKPKPAPSTVKPPVEQGYVQPGIQQVVKKELVLKYRWEGNCPECNTPVRTVVLRANGATIAVALCLTHEEVAQRIVVPLEEPTIEIHRAELAKELFPSRKKVKKDAK